MLVQAKSDSPDASQQGEKKLVAKIGDLGLSQIVLDGQTKTSTKMGGTLPYLDPKFVQTGHYTVASDVYSFGLIVL